MSGSNGNHFGFPVDEEKLDAFRADLLRASEAMEELGTYLKNDPDFLANHADAVIRQHNHACQMLIGLGQAVVEIMATARRMAEVLVDHEATIREMKAAADDRGKPGGP
jgi:hypothetical protein